MLLLQASARRVVTGPFLDDNATTPLCHTQCHVTWCRHLRATNTGMMNGGTNAGTTNTGRTNAGMTNGSDGQLAGTMHQGQDEWWGQRMTGTMNDGDDE